MAMAVSTKPVIMLLYSLLKAFKRLVSAKIGYSLYFILSNTIDENVLPNKFIKSKRAQI